jgi:diguanylate cyclase (GGDEF)-like protein
VRFDGAGRGGAAVGFWSLDGVGDAVAGTDVRVDADPVAARVGATGRPVRLDLTGTGTPVPSLLGGAYRSAVGAPIVVDGRAWGMIVAGAGASDALGPDAERRLEGFAELVGLAVAAADARAQLATLATTDHLTGLGNRRAFDERLSAEVERAQRHGRPLGLVMIDIDRFKEVNDAHGHALGDTVLVELARRLRAAARHGETVARIGGEEFAWILPESDGDAALAAAERVRAAVARDPFPGAGPLTASAGVCDLETAGSGAELLRLADAALYQAKARGRDRVVCHRCAEAGAPLV